jgi:hypothetical protein
LSDRKREKCNEKKEAKNKEYSNGLLRKICKLQPERRDKELVSFVRFLSKKSNKAQDLRAN